ncbi:MULTISPECIES: AAA family ATPase [Streptomyces]|uniref:AAA family ATPase n=1 Tax=Streptomyces TaxID=1883 RepID=UPI000E0E77B3|nr:ATP-binding protein [Streptomyces sp. SID8455]
MSAPHHCPSPGDRSLPPLDLAPGTPLSAVGPAASGKSTYAETMTVDAWICLDTLRQGRRRSVRRPGHRGTAENPPGTALDRRGDHFVDSTKIEVHVRADLVEQARPHDHPVVALRFRPDLSTCLARNAQRPPAGGYRRTPCAGSTALLGKPPRRPAPRGLHRRARRGYRRDTGQRGNGLILKP